MNRSPTTGPRTHTRPRRTLVALLQAVGALGAFAVTLGALPWLLWHATAAITPSAWEAARHLLDRQDTGALALLAVCMVGWLAWASFLLSVLLEIPAQLRGVRTPRLPGMQISQRAAAALVGSLLVLLPTGTALAASPAQAAPRAATSVSAEAAPGPRTQVQTATHTGGAQAPQARHDTYTVRDTRPAESLWSIAERLYGHGEAYTHLTDANEGRTMADGRTFHADAPIYPGWVLQLPADVPRLDTTPGPTSTTTPDASHERSQMPAETAHAGRTHVVEPGDTLTGVAREETGNAANWPTVYEASRSTQPGGLPRITDPDVLLPGQRLTVPAQLPTGPGASAEHAHGHGRPSTPHRGERGHNASSGGAQTASPPTRQQEHPAGPSAHQGENKEKDSGRERPGTDARHPAPPSASASTQPSAPSRESDGSSGRSPSAGAQPSVPAEQPPASPTTRPPAAGTAPSATRQPPQDAPGSPVSARTTLRAFALLAGVITASLLARRLWQWRTRRPGQQVPAHEPVPVEVALEEAAHDGARGVQRLQTALRLLAQQPAGEGPPVLRAARITDDSVQVLPEDLGAAVQAPFTTARAGWWLLPHTTDLPTPNEAGAGEPPYPAMVTLGATGTGELLLADLTAWQVLLIDGDREERAQVMAAMATELAIGPCADYLEVLTCGMGPMAADLRTLGVRYVADPRIAAGEFAQRILEAHQDPAARGYPYLVLCAADAEDDILWQLAETLSRAEQLTPCALILPAAAADVFPDADILDAATDGPQRVDAVGADLMLQRLDPASLAELARACAHTEQPADEPQGVWEHVPPEPVAAPGPAVPPLSTVPAPAGTGETDGLAAAAEPDDVTGPGPSAGQPTGFQALLAASTVPGPSDLRPAPAAEEQPEAGPAIGPRFRIPVAHALTAPERLGPLPKIDADRIVAEAGAHHGAPRLRVLGALAMDNLPNGPAGPRLVELAAHLLLKPGSSADRLCEDLGDAEPWSPRTLSARLRDLRSALGTDPDGTLYIPHRSSRSAPYTMTGVQCDWHDFERLAELGLSRGPDGLPYLERALALVNGVPLNAHPATWMTGIRTRMQTDITNIAHTVASHRTQDGPHQDLPSARTACHTGLTVDSYCEWLHRDLMRAEAAAGNHTGLRAAIDTWQEMTSNLPPGQADRATSALVDELLNAS
ncbi:BTAD domain-containing putative transcriptional regulator [Streptomyces sp. NPDC016845]|uniref:BTAD domain-containing putative transcriptional regulator n=1 Tax=Streptomyces sp. NPDC016845 TaxID=3364972 RepID=UPI0037B194B6